MAFCVLLAQSITTDDFAHPSLYPRNPLVLSEGRICWQTCLAAMNRPQESRQTFARFASTGSELARNNVKALSVPLWQVAICKAELGGEHRRTRRFSF